MKHAVDRPSQAERAASGRLMALRNCWPCPNASAAAPISSVLMMPRTTMTSPTG